MSETDPTVPVRTRGAAILANHTDLAAYRVINRNIGKWFGTNMQNIPLREWMTRLDAAVLHADRGQLAKLSAETEAPIITDPAKPDDLAAESEKILDAIGRIERSVGVHIGRGAGPSQLERVGLLLGRAEIALWHRDLVELGRVVQATRPGRGFSPLDEISL